MNYQLTSCIPMLETDNLANTIDFYSKKLGFHLIELYPNAQFPTWANMKRENVELMFTKHAKSSPELTNSSVYIYPTNVDAAWEEMKDCVTVEHPIESFDSGMREFVIRDCNGHILHFGKPTV